MQESTYFRNVRFWLLSGLYCLFGCCLFCSTGWAQRPSFSPDGFFRMLDRNGDGRVTEDETSRMPGSFRENLQRSGIDLRRGATQEDFSRAMDRMRQEREQSGGGSFFSRGSSSGRPDFGRGGSDRGESDRDRSDDDRRRDWERRREEERRRDEDRKPDDRGNTSGTKILQLKPKERVTVDLQESYTEGDIDDDGQIGLYEWRQWKRGSLEEFLALDRNFDGFLTPREIQEGPRETTTGGESVVIVNSSGTPVGSGAASASPGATTNSSTNSPATPTSTTSVDSTGVDKDSVAYKRGESMFRILDRDRDGSVSVDEWNASSRLKPMFEKAGVDLASPMPKEAFLAHYVKISESQT
ncbi:MAG: hypothetical protein KDA80_03130 [Planctomycetaceae bacterium]|nr:hypothetical protein [Planctomycetaceae bacterium]